MPCLLLLPKLWLCSFGPTVQPDEEEWWGGQGQLCGLIALAVQVASATPFSDQMLFTALVRGGLPSGCGCGGRGAEHITPSSSREQGSFRQSLGNNRESRQWFPGYLAQFLSLGH